MNPIFIESMNKIFTNKFVIETTEGQSFIRFPSKSPYFGDIEIYEDALNMYIVVVGKFTHAHFDVYEGSDDEKISEAMNDVIRFLEYLFTDQVICWGSHEGGGGYSLTEHYEDDGWGDLYVWSGLLK